MTLGQIFKQKREESGRSLEQLAALTKIHIKILRALETDVYDTLPARAFTRGFIVNYAKALKLDPDQILKDHHDFLEQHFQDRKDRDQGHQGYVFEGKELEQNRRWMTIGATIAIVFAAATLFIFKPQNHKHKEQHKEFEEETQLNADGDPVEAPMPPPTLKESPIPVTAVAPTASVSPNAPKTELPMKVIESEPFNHPPTPIPSASPVLAVAPKMTATPAPTAAPKPTPAQASPTPQASPADPNASPTPKEDKLNKGDDLTPKETKYKITFQAKEDLWIRYQVDEKPIGTIILRKDRYLVIKAKSKLNFETNHPESIRYKTKGGYEDLSFSKGAVENDATIKEDTGVNLGAKSLPDQVPSPAAH